MMLYCNKHKLQIAAREPNRIAREQFIFASFGVLLLARLVSCFAKSHQNPSKMHSLSGASSFDAADFFNPKSFSRRAYRQYVQGERYRDWENLPVKTNLVRLPCGYRQYCLHRYNICGFSKIMISLHKVTRHPLWRYTHERPVHAPLRCADRT